MIQTLTFNTDKQWLVIDAEQINNQTILNDTYDIDDEIIEYALDKDERAHIEYDRDRRSLTVIYNVIDKVKDENHYETSPITLIAEEERLITIINKHTQYLIPIMTQHLKQNPNMSIYHFLFATLELISDQYFPIINQIDKEKDVLNRRLRQQTSKKNLLALSDLETGNVYLVAAANQNVLLINQLKKHALFYRLTDDEKEQLDDALIEANQIVSMTQLISQILDQLDATYNNVLNNNLNDNLTYLNIISILLSIIAVITGFFGMNVDLPLLRVDDAWIYIVLFSAILWVILTKWLNDKFK